MEILVGIERSLEFEIKKITLPFDNCVLCFVYLYFLPTFTAQI
jgi:hypothetical protein